ncbi:DUF4292 domain-containing protein [Algibacter sp. L1A34]|uniref:DUF4292 domain-containing protein n=1 Tax=Algibacter sp. L1A34 TaxID=2686365 RepID=UPI00131A9F5A|nr:DUF4292 domain-containing protein [Algibacter sp. L1A34]
MNKSIYYILSFILLLSFSCKSVRTITGGAGDLNMSSKAVIKENTKKRPDFKTLQAKLRINFNKNGKSQTNTVSFRAKKDEVLWMNAPFSVIRAMITPEKVGFYNKLDNTYFEGDFSYLSKLLGTELDFQKVQNLLLGDAIFNLNSGSYSTSIIDEAYVLQPKKQQLLFEIFFLIDPSLFKIKSQQISQPKEFRHLQIDYLSHQEVEKQILPENIKVIAVEGNEETIINLEFKSVALNEDLRFPFKIPSGFKKIELE